MEENYLVIKESSFKKAYIDMKKSFFQKIFLGFVAILINGQSYSAAALTPAVLKNKKRGTLIGEEAGGSYHLAFAGTSKYVTLKNSRLKIRIPLISLIYDVDEDLQERRRGVVPDIKKVYAIEYLNGNQT